MKRSIARCTGSHERSLCRTGLKERLRKRTMHPQRRVRNGSKVFSRLDVKDKATFCACLVFSSAILYETEEGQFVVDSRASMHMLSVIRSHSGSSHFLVERARCFFFFWFTSFSGFVLSTCLQPSFVVSHSFSLHVRAMERMCQYLRCQPHLDIWVLLTVLFLTLKGQDTRKIHKHRKIAASLAEFSRMENCVQTLSQTVASHDAKITNIEQICSSLAARVTALETNATSVSSGSGSATSWNMLGQRMKL